MEAIRSTEILEPNPRISRCHNSKTTIDTCQFLRFRLGYGRQEIINLIAARFLRNSHLTLPEYYYIRRGNFRRVTKEEERVSVTEYSKLSAKFMNMHVRQV